VPCFGSANSTGLTGAFFVSSDSKEFREKHKERGKGRGAKATVLRRLGEELRREEKSGEGDGDGLNCEENPSRLRVNMGKGSIELAKR